MQNTNFYKSLVPTLVMAKTLETIDWVGEVPFSKARFNLKIIDALFANVQTAAQEMEDNGYEQGIMQPTNDGRYCIPLVDSEEPGSALSHKYALIQVMKDGQAEWTIEELSSENSNYLGRHRLG